MSSGMKISVDEIVERLTREFGYPAEGARLASRKIEAMTPEVYGQFVEWWTLGNVPSTERHGYTMKSLMSDHGQNPIAAFLTMDWLAREPLKADAAIRKGRDSVRLH